MHSQVTPARKEEHQTPLVIYRSVDRAGATFALSPAARRFVEKRFGGEAHPAPRVFVAHTNREDYAHLREDAPTKLALLQLLTGLKQLGQVEFRDPMQEEPL